MTASEIRLWRQLARLHGIQTSYFDVAGQRQEASTDTLQAILKILGVPVNSAVEVRDAIREHFQNQCDHCLEPVTVVWNGRPGFIQVRIPATWSKNTFRCHLRLENGESQRWEQPAGNLGNARTASPAVTGYISKKLPLPKLPLGYHQFEVETPNGLSRSLVFSAPTRSYAEPGAPKQWGVFLPMYAAHSEQSWGAGNFTDWKNFSGWVGANGGHIVATLPLLAAFLDRPFEPSPYSPASRLFWNEFYLDVT